MPLPTPSDLHVNGYLTNVSVAYLQTQDKYVADQVFPRVPVQKQSDLYATFDKADFLRDEMEKRGPSSESAGVGYRVSNDSYFCEVWALHIDVDDRQRANADSPFSPDRNATQVLTQKELIKREVEWGSAFFTTGIWTGSSNGSDLVAGTDFTAWDDVSSTPIENVQDEMAEVESNTSFLPNTLVVTRRGWMSLRNHPDIVDRIKGGATSGSPAVVTRAAVASLMELDQILVAAAVRNTAQEGLAGSYDYILGNHALLCYAAPSPQLEAPSAGYTFVWNGLIGSAEGRRVSSFRMDELKSDRIEIEATWDQKVVAADLGVFFQNIVS